MVPSPSDTSMEPVCRRLVVLDSLTGCLTLRSSYPLPVHNYVLRVRRVDPSGALSTVPVLRETDGQKDRRLPTWTSDRNSSDSRLPPCRGDGRADKYPFTLCVLLVTVDGAVSRFPPFTG